MGKHIPFRMCVACREMHPKNELIRIVKDRQSGEIIFDEQQKLQTRGIYLCKNEECVKLAAKKRAIERHLKCNTNESIYERAKEFWIRSLD